MVGNHSHAMATASDIPQDRFAPTRVLGNAAETPPVIKETSQDRERRIRPTAIVTFIAALVTGAIVAAVYFFLDPTRVAIFPPCLFHQLTGLDCPGCGAQRALHQLLHGHWIAAIRLNAMFVLSLPLLAWMGFRFLTRSVRNEPWHPNSRWWSAYIAAWIIFAIVRNLPFPVCQWFAP